MTTKLALYNKAGGYLGERLLANLSEDTEARYLLDAEYDEALLYCARRGLWNFMLRAVKADASSTIIPEFGYQYAVPKPADWLGTQLISPSEFFDPPLMDYSDQTGYWLTNMTPIYVRYINGTDGTNPAMFPADYIEYVASYLASKILMRATGKSVAEYDGFVKDVVKPAYRQAIARDGQDQAPQAMPKGTWTTSRSRRGGQSMFPYNF